MDKIPLPPREAEDCGGWNFLSCQGGTLVVYMRQLWLQGRECVRETFQAWRAENPGEHPVRSCPQRNEAQCAGFIMKKLRPGKGEGPSQGVWCEQMGDGIAKLQLASGHINGSNGQRTGACVVERGALPPYHQPCELAF